MRAPAQGHDKPAFFYGWYIVGVGFLSYLVCAFTFSSTLSVFVRPMTEELQVSRGTFSLLRTGEIIIGGLLAPWIGPLVDRSSGRWLMAVGALAAGAGFLLLSQIREFWQFLLLRWILITAGGAFMCSMVVTVTISRWFVRKRGRALAIATLGQGVAKVCIPLVAASLFVWLGWRGTWAVFGLLTLALVVGPALIFMRRRPEDMGLYPDGASDLHTRGDFSGKDRRPEPPLRPLSPDVVWSRAEILRSRPFWLIAITYGVANVGVVGLNLHVFAYVIDIGYPAIVAGTVLSVIAFTQLSSTLFWGFLSERIEMRKATTLMFVIQAAGLALAIATTRPVPLYAGFFLYGVGLGGSQVLQEVIWASFYGRSSLGRVRGLGLAVSNFLAAGGPPFFGYLFDVTRSYLTSFILFIIALIVSAILILPARPPQK